jgi:hypothetical protein
VPQKALSLSAGFLSSHLKHYRHQNWMDSDNLDRIRAGR